MLRNFLSLLKRRYIVAAKNSFKGLKIAFQNEEAFRVQVILSIFLIPLAWFIANSYQQLLMLLMTLFLVMIVELLNTSIELAVDRIGTEFNELSGRAKDTGSAAVALSMFIFVLVWSLIIAANLGLI